ncbi:MAG: RnfABCDGE type electron transport complex subunit D, partial [Clostridia bacterium]|nr:RnfABCDGE type electron transport complex subunit D [Clostridia bacterium]
MDPSMPELSLKPSLRGRYSQLGMSADVMIALVPCTAFGCFMFGLRALVIVLLSIVVSVLAETVLSVLFRIPLRLKDGTAVITGWIFALTLPVTVPLWAVAAGIMFGQIVGKMIFGGCGNNILNPALTGRLFLRVCFPAMLEKFVAPGTVLSPVAVTLPEDYETVRTVTQILTAKELPRESIYDLFLGTTGGAIGTVSAFFV